MDAELDAIITQETVVPSRQETSVLGLFAFVGSPFDQKRSTHAHHGIALRGGEHAPQDFYTLYLAKALRYAGTIEICDQQAGAHYAGNYRHTLQNLFRLYAQDCSSGATKAITLHIGDGARRDHCCTEIPSLCRDLQILIRVYDGQTAATSLPHERYLLTDQFAFEIGRGLDLFDSSTNRNRDVSISFKDPKIVEQLMPR